MAGINNLRCSNCGYEIKSEGRCPRCGTIVKPCLNCSGNCSKCNAARSKRSLKEKSS
ncbi:MAG: hypothetical protein ACM3TR_19600 [Caulobacteraceae bacterium]